MANYQFFVILYFPSHFNLRLAYVNIINKLVYLYSKITRMKTLSGFITKVQMFQSTLCAILTTRLISILPKYLVTATTAKSYESKEPYSFKKFNCKLTWMEHCNRFVCLIRNSYRKYICSALLKLAFPC